MPLVVLLVAGGFVVVSLLLPSAWIWVHEPLHSTAEGLGALIALGVAALILVSRAREPSPVLPIWVPVALIGMGLLDGFHAVVRPGNPFVWLHSVATFAGGALFALVWFPDLPSSGRAARRLPFVTALGATAIGVVSLAWPEALPRMVAVGRFTVTAQALNVAGGVLFLAAAFRFVRLQQAAPHRARSLFAVHCSLFGVAGILFELSSLWDAPWWWWHVLRLAAYATALWWMFATLLELDRGLAEREERYRRLFEESPVPMWEEDFSAVRSYLDRLGGGGGTDLRAHFVEHPDAVRECVARIRVLDVNRAALELCRAEDKRQLLAGLDRVFTECSFETVREELVALAGGGTGFREEAEIRTLDGEPRHVSLGMTVMPGHERTLARVLVSCADITERRRAEHELARNEELGRRLLALAQRLQSATSYEALLDLVLAEVRSRLAYGSVWLYIAPDDPEGDWRLLSVRGPRAAVVSREIPGLAVRDDALLEEIAHATRPVVVADARTDPRTNKDLVAATEVRTMVHVPLTLLDQRLGMLGTGTFAGEGVRPPERAELDYLAAMGGHVAAALGRIQFLDALREARDELGASESRYRSLIEQSPFSTVIFRPDGRPVFSNAACSRLWGIPPDELARMNERYNIFEDEQLEALGVMSHIRCGFAGTATTVPAARYDPQDTPLLREAGSTGALWLESFVYPIRDDAGEIREVVLVHHDVSERHRLEEQIRHAQKLESLGVLAGGIAHDFNNLLVGVLGNAGLALGELGPGTSARKFVEEIKVAATRAAELCRQMLAYSGKGRFDIEPLDLNELIHELTQLLRAAISKKATLEPRLAPLLPAIEADATQVRQVVMNLITNASEAIEDGGGMIEIVTGVMTAGREYLRSIWAAEDLQPGRYVYVEVSDDGCGMSAETLARLWDPFFTTKFTGRGLGLAAVIGIVRGHGGAIHVQSEVGRGTTFRVLFPASDLRAEVREAREPRGSRAVEGRAWRGSGTILVVDDEETVREMARETLEQVGFDVIEASDGRKALALFRELSARIDAVLLDLTMPNLGGEETFREMRRLRGDVRVLLTSGYAVQDVEEDLAGPGPAAFLQKPYLPSELVHKVRGVLETAPPEREREG